MGSLPFTIEQFLDVFKEYNQAVWPMQIVLTALAILLLVLVIFQMPWANQISNLILAVFWFWMGAVYHFLFFSQINKGAYLFGSLFLLQGFVFLYFAILKPDRLDYQYRADAMTFLGILFVAYALVIYPILGNQFGHVYPAKPTFGLPCPITIFTFGVLLFSAKRIPWFVVLIPFLWSLIGFSAALNLHIQEDFGLVVAGILGTISVLFLKPRPKATRTLSFK